MLASGYIPDEHNHERFGRLARTVTSRPEEEALSALRERGSRDYPDPTFERVATLAPIPAPDAQPQVIAVPTVVMFRGDVFTVRKELVVPGDLAAVGDLVRPQNWKQLGPFWDDIQVTPDVIYEKFVINWNLLQLHAFEVHLRYDYRETADRVRTAYSLIHEENDELLVDEGYGEARREPGLDGWTRYIAEKTLKFSSNLQNLLSPGLLAMFLERHGDTLRDKFNHVDNRPNNHRPARRIRH